MKWIKLKLRSNKRLVAVLIAVGIMAAAGFYVWGSRATAADYMTARVERGNLRNTVTATGTLQAVTTVLVGSQASGTISALYVDFNSTVKKGQVIAQLDPATSQAQVQQSRANLEQARASLQNSHANLTQAKAGVTDARARSLASQSTVQNQQAGVSSAEANLAVLQAQRDDALSSLRQQESLSSSGIISQRELEIAQTAFRTAEARYNQAVAQLNQAKLSEQSSSTAGVAQSQAQLEQAQAQVEQASAQVRQSEAQVSQAEAALRLAEINSTHTTIRSPIDGVVVSRDVDVGQTVAASLSAPTLFTIANDLTQMQVIANIDQADIGLVEQAKSVNFTVDAFPGEDFKGTIQQIRLNPQTVQNVVTYNVVIDVNNPEQKLKPGMTANLIITIDERNSVLKVPNAALRFMPQNAGEQRRSSARGGQDAGEGEGQNPRRRQRQQSEEGRSAGQGSSGENATNSEGRRGGRPASPTSPVVQGQSRVVWVLGQDGKPQSRRITIGLTDGSATEVTSGSLQEGEMVVIGETITAANNAQSNQASAPGFGGGPRGGGGGGRRR
ncbi:MAG TPA: efflux RND transporter periplasmic adaptor subunit [Pyrinomonadaceae bacterium]|nr:efflux RND transporter periplasmic adaptor subunit [Pyrinomonadaceae bacterium]